jgi:hypothetical protein
VIKSTAAVGSDGPMFDVDEGLRILFFINLLKDLTVVKSIQIVRVLGESALKVRSWMGFLLNARTERMAGLNPMVLCTPSGPH